MGSARWDPSAWTGHTTATAGMSRAAIFSGGGMDKDLDPLNFAVRESCDSLANPLSTPVIVAVDVTGSMGELAEIIVRTGLGTIMEEVYARKPVTDPHVLLAAIGDSYMDSAPFQATQFEADIKLAEQLSKFFLEGGGGGNSGESYNLAYYFAAMKTKCDAMLKRQKKGYLFTVGDECPLPHLPKDHIKRVFGDDAEADMSTVDLLAMASQGWEVFHLMVKPVRHQPVKQEWTKLLGERAIQISDHTKLAEVIVSTMQVIEGHDAAAVAKSWTGDTAVVVRDAVAGLTKAAGKSAPVHRL